MILEFSSTKYKINILNIYKQKRKYLNVWWRNKNLSKLTRIFENKIKQLWGTNMQTKVMLWVNSRLEKGGKKLINGTIRVQNRQHKDKQEIWRKNEKM